MKKIAIPTIITAGALVCVLLAFATTYQVRYSQVVVKVRAGKPLEDSVRDQPGIYFRWPLVDALEPFDRRLQTLDASESEIKTVDGNNVIVSSFIVWEITDPLKYMQSGSREEVAGQVRNRVNQAQAAVIGQHKLSDFVNLDPTVVENTYDQFGQEMMAAVGPSILANYGIHARTFGIRRISLPESVTATVFNTMSQERKQLATRYREEGKSIAEAIKATAQSAADSIMAFTSRKAAEVRSTGVAAGASVLDQIATEDREFFEWLRWLDALRATFKQRTTIFLDEKSPFFDKFVNSPVPLSTTRPAAASAAGNP